MEMIFIDPPEGWKFGFPMPWDGLGEPTDLSRDELVEWLVKNGYPRSFVDQYAEEFRVRLISQ